MIETNRFIIKPLEVTDVSLKYLGWLNNRALMRYLLQSTRESEMSLAELKDYVIEKSSNNKIYFYGIFIKNTFEHIGNIKYEIEADSKKYFMGILIGEVFWHGKGVAVEVIDATKKFDSSVNDVYLVVSAANVMAIRAYIKCGFKQYNLENFSDFESKSVVMRLDT